MCIANGPFTSEPVSAGHPTNGFRDPTFDPVPETLPAPKPNPSPWGRTLPRWVDPGSAKATQAGDLSVTIQEERS